MTNPNNPSPIYPSPTYPYPAVDDHQAFYGAHPGYYGAHPGDAPPPAGYPPTWSIPTQRGYPGPGLHPAGLGGFPAPEPPRQGTSGLAIATLALGILAVVILVVAVVIRAKGDVAGLVGIVLIGVVLIGLVLGVVALVQLRGSGRSGLPLAIVGLVLSAVVAIVLAVGVVVTATGSAPGPAAAPVTPSPSATPTAPATPTAARGVPTSTDDLEVGDCIQTLPDTATVSRVDVVTCTAPHEGEVFYEYTVAGQSYPGDQQLQRRTSDTCNDRYRTLAPTAFADDAYNLAIYSPTRQSWATGSREVTCIATARTPVTGSVIGR